MRLTSVLLALVLAAAAASATDKSTLNQPAMTLSNSNELLLPANYRSWVAVAPTLPGMPSHLHRNLVSKVYVEPVAYERFVKSGAWPNHTVIVLELRDRTVSERAKCHGVIGLEVAAKDDAKAPDSWNFYGIIYDHQKEAQKAAASKTMCNDCGEQPADTRLAMFFPALKAVIHASPRTMQPSAF